jgi:hypothetical protein
MRDRCHTRGRRRRLSAALVAAATVLAAAPAGAQANAYAPPHHRVFHGVSDTGNADDFRTFRAQVGAHPAVLEDFYHWNTPLTTGALQRWNGTDTRGVLSLSSAPGGAPEIVSPGGIARGRQDDYIIDLARSIADSGQVVYIRLFPEMNGSWNPYCAFNADGTRKGWNHSTAMFRRAWRRFALIARGGRRATINRKLHRLKMPRIYRAHSNRDPEYAHKDLPHRLPHPKVAFLWNPQTVGSPPVPGNAPRNYWPGGRYVDWVGADIYSKYAGFAFPHLTSFYRHWKGRPFFIGEYSPWDADPGGLFVQRLFHWAKRHGRTRMLIYYRSVVAGSAFDIGHFPEARSELRRMLSRSRYAEYAPGTRHHGSG